MRSGRAGAERFRGIWSGRDPHKNQSANRGGTCVRLKPEPHFVYIGRTHGPRSVSYDLGEQG